jgi:peptidoglycan/xylan/chitin deacetylase (PgdA/CDA1 family)
VTRRGCRILNYHRFPGDPSSLTAECEHIRRHYHPISLAEVVDCLAGGARFPDNALAVTVDDGYRDFLLHAHPVFSAFEIPITVFLVTDFIDRTDWLWWDKVSYILEKTERHLLQFEGSNLTIEKDRSWTSRQVTERLKRVPNEERLRVLEDLPRQLQVEIPDRAPAEYRPLTWDEVRNTLSSLVEFGSHTRSHPILSSITTKERLLVEIDGSRQRMREELGVAPKHFAYPDGTRRDYDSRTIAVVRECGFASAVAADSGFNYSGADRFALCRMGFDPSLSMLHFTELLAGLRKY